MKKKRTFTKLLVSMVLAMTVIMSSYITAFAATPYVHDPMANSGAAKDIVVDPNAVYGYAPSPTSSRLKDYVDYDWSDPVLVGKMRKQREEYHDSMKELYTMITNMKAAGSPVKDIAIAVSTRRNELRLESYKDDPVGLAKVKKSNLENYGNENGGTPEFFYNKYGSWETVIEKAISTNAGADAVLGLYDKYYDTYFITSSDAASATSAIKFTQPVVIYSAPVSNDLLQNYTVVSGDSLSKIAQSLLGDKAKWEDIYALNSDQIKDPNVIYPGQILKVQ